MNIFDRIRIRKICDKILRDKGKSKAVVMAEFEKRKKKNDKPL